VIVSTLLPAYVIGGLLYAAMRMWRAARAAEGTAAAPRLRYLFYASLLALALGQPGIPVVGATFTAVYLYFMAQTLVRERLLDLPEILGRITVMTLLVITVTAVYAALLLWVPWRFADEPMLLVFNTLLASFAVLMLVDPLRTELERRLEGWVFRERSALRAILVQLRQRLANVIDPDEMVKAVLGSLRESNRVTRAAFFLVDRQGLALTLRGHLGAPVLERLDLATRRPLLERLRQGPQLRDVLQRQRERARSELQAELDESLQTLAEIGASLALPVLGRNTTDDGQAVFDLLGVLFVEDERLLEPFSREEVELFAGVVAQAAVMIENSKVYEQRKERRPPRRARADGRRPRPRDPQPARRDQGRRPGRRARHAGRRPHHPRIPRRHRRGGRPPQPRRHPVPQLLTPLLRRDVRGPARRCRRRHAAPLPDETPPARHRHRPRASRACAATPRPCARSC
jgi:two-component system sensor histidine kinase HydH